MNIYKFNSLTWYTDEKGNHIAIYDGLSKEQCYIKEYNQW